jgi:hypothetical protein
MSPPTGTETGGTEETLNTFYGGTNSVRYQVLSITIEYWNVGVRKTVEPPRSLF